MFEFQPGDYVFWLGFLSPSYSVSDQYSNLFIDILVSLGWSITPGRGSFWTTAIWLRHWEETRICGVWSLGFFHICYEVLKHLRIHCARMWFSQWNNSLRWFHEKMNLISAALFQGLWIQAATGPTISRASMEIQWQPLPLWCNRVRLNTLNLNLLRQRFHDHRYPFDVEIFHLWWWIQTKAARLDVDGYGFAMPDAGPVNEACFASKCVLHLSWYGKMHKKWVSKPCCMLFNTLFALIQDTLMDPPTPEKIEGEIPYAKVSWLVIRKNAGSKNNSGISMIVYNIFTHSYNI